MKRSLLLIFFMYSMLLLPLFSQETVTEKVTIDWWVLPLFAVDKGGDAVLDLTNRDINLWVNNQRISDFTIYKREFSVDTITSKPGKKEPLPQFTKSKIVFLLFDLAFTTSTNYIQAKEVAKNLVRESDQKTLFSIIAIDPLVGPKYIGGPLSDKKEATRLIDEKIGWDAQTKSIKIVLKLAFSTQMFGKKQNKKSKSKGKGPKNLARLTPKEMAYLTEQRSSGWRKANMLYHRSFATLYHALSSIKDNKFIYLFSEGISLFARAVVTHGQEEYWFFMKQTAGYLGKSGAVLFIVNPAGVTVNERSIQSGESSLRYLAKESGGKYIEGETKTINRQIATMYRAYYEIAFPDQDSFKGDMRHITISSRRKGVKIHTLRNLEKGKQYGEMDNLEKEILALNLLNPSPLFRSPLKTEPLKIARKTGNKDEILYKIALPPDFKRKSIDLFKIRLSEDTAETRVVKETIITKKKLEIGVKKSGDVLPRLVLVNEKTNRALVQGLFDVESEMATLLASSASGFKKKIKQMAAEEIKALDRVKTGSASYCAGLEDAAFHYICKETVSEVLQTIRTQKGVKEVEFNTFTGSRLAEERDRLIRRKLTNKYVNDYQLISNKGRVKEQRKLLKGKVKKIGGKEDLLKIDSFISRKISLCPISLLGDENQKRFHYRFVKYDSLKGVECAVIACFPKNMSAVKSIYGKMWIDLSDSSLMRISVNPVSIGGYGELLKRARDYARNLKAKQVITCEIDFFKKRGGIRFPTRVSIRETYSGGVELRHYAGKAHLERSKTTYTFHDYQFFDVEAASSIGNRD